MAGQSKVATGSPNWNSLIYGVLFGSHTKKAVTTLVFLIIGFLLYMRSKNSPVVNIKPRPDQKKKGGKGNVDAIFWERIKVLVRIVIPTWKCQQVLDLCLLTVFLVLRTFMSIYLAGVNGKIVKAIIDKNFSLFLQRVLKLGILAVPASFVNSFLDFLNRRLALNFKRRLTNHFHATYLKDMIYYQLGNIDSRVSNPDQRLTADIDKWSTSLSTIYSNFSKPALDIFLFSRKLAELVSWRGPFLIIMWYLASGIVLKFVSPPFGRLTAIEQRLEGDYRSSHADIVHHSQQIAFYKGNNWELTRIGSMFNKFTGHSEAIMNKKLFMGVFDSMLVKYGAVMMGYAVLGMPVFGPGHEEYLKKVGTDPSVLTRDYIRNSSLLINLAKAIGRMVISYKQVQQLAGLTTLVYEMKEVLDDLSVGRFVRTQICKQSERKEAIVASMNDVSKGRLELSDNVIRFIRVPLISPSGDVFISEMTFEVKRGVNTIVTGPNGCGKSSLFRILSGLWPLPGGVLQRPQLDKIFYIPQRPYLPPGTLRDQVIYPHTKQTFLAKSTDDDIRKFLSFVKLDYIEKRQNGFDSINQWNDVLSGGEKQRIAMARLFYHRPMFAILDQCTSAVSMDVEAQLYKTAKQMDITLFTVSHRSSLFKFHDIKLTFDGDKGYEITGLNKE